MSAKLNTRWRLSGAVTDWVSAWRASQAASAAGEPGHLGEILCTQSEAGALLLASSSAAEPQLPLDLAR